MLVVVDVVVGLLVRLGALVVDVVRSVALGVVDDVTPSADVVVRGVVVLVVVLSGGHLFQFLRRLSCDPESSSDESLFFTSLHGSFFIV